MISASTTLSTALKLYRNLASRKSLLSILQFEDQLCMKYQVVATCHFMCRPTTLHASLNGLLKLLDEILVKTGYLYASLHQWIFAIISSTYWVVVVVDYQANNVKSFSSSAKLIISRETVSLHIFDDLWVCWHVSLNWSDSIMSFVFQSQHFLSVADAEFLKSILKDIFLIGCADSMPFRLETS